MDTEGTKQFTVAVFEHEGKRKPRLFSYLRDYNPAWKGCCLHRVDASTGKLAKRVAEDQHRRHCMTEREAVPCQELARR